MLAPQLVVVECVVTGGQTETNDEVGASNDTCRGHMGLFFLEITVLEDIYGYTQDGIFEEVIIML